MSKTILMFFALIALSLTQNLTASRSAPETCCQNNKIQVSGLGRTSAIPDMATLSLRFNENGKTTAQAVKALTDKVNLALALLNAKNYTYQTTYMYSYPIYNYSNGTSQIVGQTVTLSLTAKITKIDTSGKNLALIIDALAKINGINIDSVSFDVTDKTILEQNARTAAYQNAKIKAKDYASLAGKILGRLVKVDDSSTVYTSYLYGNSSVYARPSMGTTSVPIGETFYQYNTQATFALI